MTKIIDGKEFAQKIRNQVKEDSDNLFRNNVMDEASRLGITNNLSQAASSSLYGGVNFDKQNNVYTKRVMKDLKANVKGFDQLTEGEQEKLFNARVDRFLISRFPS